MAKTITHDMVLQHPFMKEVKCAFKHIPSVVAAFNSQDINFFLGCPMSALQQGMPFEEYFVRNLLKKCSNLQYMDHDPTDFAQTKFKGFMQRQEEKHMFVSSLLERIDATTDVGRVLLLTRKLFRQLFHGFHETVVRPRFTSGATVTLSRVEATSPFKRYEASEGLGVLHEIRKRRESEGKTRLSFTSDFFPQHGDDKTWQVNAGFVPKTWKEDRLIGFNPSAALAVQAGVGDWMTGRLRSSGIDISTAQDRHKRIARQASLLDSHLMTADQSNASDNILKVLVKFLADEDLYEYLTDITPGTVHLDDGTVFHGVHMMATAGNGYIFPLQTALFACIAKAICIVRGVKPEVYSYGDDLIAPVAIYPQLVKVFNLVGLEINTEKTFTEPGIRESCGGDYVNGEDVRPFYVKELPNNTLEWIRCINGIRRVGFVNNLGYWRTNNIRRLWLWCIAHVRPEKRLFAPTHYGDSAISTDDWRLYRLSYRKYYSVEGKQYKYPYAGLHPSGHPYSGWYIETYCTRSVGKGRTFGQEVQGLNSRDVLRLLTLSSVKGAGLCEKLVKYDDNKVKLKQPIIKLAYPVFFGKDELRVERQVTPFFSGPPAPSDNINDLFDHLSDELRIKDVELIVHDGEARYHATLVSLHDVLIRRVQTLRMYAVEAKEADLSF